MDKHALVQELNADLSRELMAIAQYLTYAARVTGPYRPELSKFFLAEVAGETAHAEYLANKVVALGGEPATAAAPVPPARSNREMLERVLDAEREAVRQYTRRIAQAEEAGEKGLAIQLENILADETQHVEETERILRDWKV